MRLPPIPPVATSPLPPVLEVVVRPLFRNVNVCLGLTLWLCAMPATATPRLAVLVVVDQLRSVEVDRLAPLFGSGGFGGLMAEGAARYDARYPYASCETSPGHATLATGASPPVHGIVSNRWWTPGGMVYSVDDPAHPVLGQGAGAAGRGPAQLRAATLGDTWKLESGGRARVVTLSHKDRAAILSAGRSADLALWYDAEQGRFTTSTAYAEALPAWVAKEQARIDRQLRTAQWRPLDAPAALSALLPTDDREGEETHALGGRTFPHDLARAPSDAERRQWYRGTPQAMEDILSLALAAVDAESLGADATPDLLVVSISATDYVGHWFGPQSLEMTDLLRRLDVALRAFVGKLDERLGRNGYVLALTADHGGTPLPEAVQALGLPAGRIHARALLGRVEQRVAEVTGAAGRRAALMPPHLWVDLQGLPAATAARALEAIADDLRATPGMAAVYPASPAHTDDPYAQRMRLSEHPGRSGHLLLRQHPRFVFQFGNEATGTDHGAPYAYDARVPLFLRGPGVARGRHPVEADPRDVAPSLAFLVQAPPPDAAEGRPLPTLGAGRP